MSCTRCEGRPWVIIHHEHPLYKRQALRCPDCWPGVTSSPESAASLMRGFGVPTALEGASLDNFLPGKNAVLAEALRLCRSFCGKWPDVRRGLLLVGPPGSGKSHLAVSVLRALALRGSDGLFLPFEVFLDQVLDREKREESRRRAYSVAVLVLDDLRGQAGARGSQARDAALALLSRRYDGGLLTICTTNHPLEAPKQAPRPAEGKTEDESMLSCARLPALDELFGAALASRLASMCAPIDFSGAADFRRRKQ